MLDFLVPAKRVGKNGTVEIYPRFKIINSSKDLMIRGRDFYAVWDDEKGFWSTSEDTVIKMIDISLTEYAKKLYPDAAEGQVKILYMGMSDTGSIDNWHRYVQKQMRDNWHPLDERLIFSNETTTREDYATKQLPYPLIAMETPAYDELMSVLYSDEERKKLEWAIGSIVNGDSKTIQKFCVLYGPGGTGKSTVMNIIQKLFVGYWSTFEAKALASSNSAFPLESLKNNPLVAIEHDGDLSRIEDNTKLNSVVSHEEMTVNEKFKAMYTTKFQCFLFMGTNRPVKITDAKSGIIRRLIDVSPTGNKVEGRRYRELMKNIEFELGGIAKHCLDVYNDDPHCYDDYIPIRMLGATNDFYNFVLDSFDIFKKDEGVTLKAAWEMYKTYCTDANVTYPMPQRIFKEEMKNYFGSFEERAYQNDIRVRNVYTDFKTDKFVTKPAKKQPKEKPKSFLKFKEEPSILDDILKDCPAQYANEDGSPMHKWANVKTTLKDISTSELHYVRVPENHIVIDFDIPGDDGEKSLEKNIEAASMWPPTYAELSKSGKGIHLHYIYAGDPKQLNRVFKEHIEVKVYTGKSSLRRKLTKCVNIDISTISSGLALKKEKEMIDFNTVKDEKHLRNRIIFAIKNKTGGGTKPAIDFIYKTLTDAYDSGISYDMSNLHSDILTFAAGSTHNSEYCLSLVAKMPFRSKDMEPEELSIKEPNYISEDAPIVFFDVEVFPNLFIICWKIRGESKPVIRMINPTAADVEALLNYRLVGFNCRRYDNHILYARLLGYTEEQLYFLSRDIIDGKKDCFFSEAYNLSYTDIYDFCSKKQSLKKWEIELGTVKHQELALPWDKPVDISLWDLVAEYCENDVLATEATFEARMQDFVAREILAELAGCSVNDTTNQLTTRIIFGKEHKPQNQFNCPDLTKEFPGYTYSRGVSTYNGEVIGEGGRVYAQPGIYRNVRTYDVASMHPHSILAENGFGPYTENFKNLIDIRVAIKHKEYDKVRAMFGGKLAKYLGSEDDAKALSFALKIAINSVYGLTAASFDNPFRDPRNKDNWVAKRGALFMETLRLKVQELGATVVHIKTDSIKIEQPSPEVEQFIFDYGKKWGYTFEIESEYEKICLVNDAVYIAKCTDNIDINGKEAGHWTATGTQFQVPYVFKTLFSKEPLIFDDYCETKSVTTSIYMDYDENLPDVSAWEKLKDLRSKAADKLTKSEAAYVEKYSDLDENMLENYISEGHCYKFVGRVGQFCPIKAGCGGAVLYREKDGKYSAVTGTKGYRWLESESVKRLGKQDDIDISYYDRLVNEAVTAISQYDGAENFI